MKQSIARALRSLADRFDPAGQRISVTNILNVHNNGSVDFAQQRLNDTRSRMQQASGALDKLVPGSSDAMKVGQELADRAIRYSGQTAGTGVHGLLESLSIHDSPQGKSWAAKIAEGLVPPRSFPVLPNAAGAPAIKAPWWRRLLRRFGR